jgi:hypothetical protein
MIGVFVQEFQSACSFEKSITVDPVNRYPIGEI